MEHEFGLMMSTKMKEKPERRRSSIFSLLRRQKKLTRQFSEPSAFSTLSLDRKLSVDSAIMSDFTKVENGGYKVELDSCCPADVFSSSNGSYMCYVFRNQNKQLTNYKHLIFNE